MIINHNLSTLDTTRNEKINVQNSSEMMSKLSSGLRINKAGDDASGLAVSEKMRAQIRGLNQASRNASDGVNFIQTAEGYLRETTDVLQRVRELAVQAANGTYSDEDRMQIQVEVSQMVDEVNRVAAHAQFNGMNMLTGRFASGDNGGAASASMWFHVGANMDQNIRVYIGTMNAAALGLDVGGTRVTISTMDNANRAIGIMDNALKIVNKQRADLGAYQNRLDMAIKGIDIGAQNLQASESQIRDLDMAKGAAEMSKNSILMQAVTAMQAQGQQIAAGVTRLLQ